MESMKPYIKLKNGYLKNKVYVSQVGIPNSDWHLIAVSSLDELKIIQKRLALTFTGIAFLSLLFSSISLALLLKFWLKPLKNLQMLMLEISHGHSQLRAEEVGSKELIDLAHQFNSMLDQIDQLVLEVTQKEQKIRQGELRALTSQINPHFLYNTLDTIIWMVEFGDSLKVVDLTKSLATFFRLSLNKGNELISLKDEINHVRQYLSIQSYRYGDKLTYDIKELKSFDNYLLPKLILQPLVENAIYHGIKELDHRGQIKIEVSSKAHYLYLTVTDNGPGFGKSKKQVYKQTLNQGIGLSNVNQRLKLHFGEGYKMRIESIPFKETSVTLRLPLHLDGPR